MRDTNWKIFIAVLALAALFRIWGAFEYKEYSNDEAHLIPVAKSVMANGIGDWRNPPLSSLVNAGAIKIFGDNSVGWRISGIILGTASVLLVYLIARRLYPESSVPVLAASLLAFDPFHINFCRTTMMETPAIFFFLLFLYLMLEYSEKNHQTLTCAGVAMGCAIATKAYFLFAILVVILFAFYRQLQLQQKLTARLILCLEFIVKLLMLPVAIYLYSFSKWFGRGHVLSEFLQFRYDAYWLYNNNFIFENEKVLSLGGKPWEWFVKPIAYGHQMFSDGQYGRFAIEINNPLFRMMVIPALCIVLYHAIKKQNCREALSPLLFAACYVLLLAVKRPINSYSSLVLLPFAYLTLAQAIVVLATRFKYEQETAIILLFVAFISGCYLFPVTAGFVVPIALYKPLIAITNFYMMVN